MLALIASGMWSMSAQVIIGTMNDSTTPHAGTVLELKSEGGKAGLLMPRVALTSATVWEPVSGTSINGMTVYNTNDTTQNGLAGKGAYVWTDGRWYPLSLSAPCTSAPALPVLSVSGLNGDEITIFKPFLAFVTNPEPGTEYEWTLPEGLIGHSNSNVITIVGSKGGTYTIKVKAKNECGESSEATYSVTIFVLPNEKDGTGNVTIQGITCYDIAQTDNTGGPCGSLVNRKPAFPDNDPSKRTRMYTLSIQDNTGISNLRVGWMDDNDGIIKSVSGDVSGTLYKNEYPITVVFADNINEIVSKTKKSTATLYAVFRGATGDKYVTLRITVQDCSCCPLDVAKIVDDAAYKGADIIEMVPNISFEETMSHFVRIPDAALCVWKKNQGNAVKSNGTNAIGNSWNEANAKCIGIMAIEGYGDGWRLPNVAEMYYNLHRIFFYDGGREGSMKGSASRFLSNTAKKGNRSNIYFTRMTENYLVIDSGSITRDNISTANFRCVKTINY
ncbi:MAG: PKD domain-containing protein [Flavobacteriaceae bacterium]|nr:PKD domain-containing protein [Flavobacteriaceae bacterium]